MITVQERLNRANAYLAEKHGIDPNNSSYKRAKEDIIYAWKHGIDVKEVNQHMRMSAVEEAIKNRVPSLAEVEKALGRPLRNTSSIAKGKIKAVVNPITAERWPNFAELAMQLNTTLDRVRGAVLHKRQLFGNYYEFEQ